MKILNKGTLLGMAIGLLAAAGIVYAAQTITSLTQTAVTGDKITANWVNAVNSRLGSPVVVAAGSNNIDCSATEGGGGGDRVLCVNVLSGKTCVLVGSMGWICQQPAGWAP